MLLYIAEIAVDVIVLMFFLLGVYYLGVAVFSFVPRKQNSDLIEYKSFDVVIPAHNEGRVIGGILQSINSSDYPEELLKIYVVADGCSDNTAKIAREYGAYVIERDKSTNKGDALREAFYHIEEKKSTSEYIAIFDADNIVDKFFFKEICERFSLGADAVQGYIDSKNPNASWVAGAHSVWYWITNRIVQSGRAKLGMGCRICGTGFAIKSDLLCSVPFNTKTMAEDAEYTCALSINNIKVDFAEKAVVFDEKPITFKESARQRRRWSRGISDVQSEYTLKLIKKRRINALLGLWNDVLGTTSFVVLFLVAKFKIGGIAQSVPGSIMLWLYIFTYMLTAIMALVADKKIRRETVSNLFGLVIYLISWIPIGIMGIIFPEREWYHIRHRESENKL